MRGVQRTPEGSVTWQAFEWMKEIRMTNLHFQRFIIGLITIEIALFMCTFTGEYLRRAQMCALSARAFCHTIIELR